MDPPSPNKLIATKYCFLILRGDTSFFLSFFLFHFFFIVVIVVIINFLKNYFIIIIIIIIIILFIFLMKIIFIFSCSGMFWYIPECFGMFRVPGFIDAPGRRMNMF